MRISAFVVQSKRWLSVFFTHRKALAIVTSALLLFIVFLVLPTPNFKKPTSTVILSSNGNLLMASIAADEQFRFPASLSVPTKFERCIIEFEDRKFYHHPGINPMAIARAAWNNIKAKRLTQGGSTITQQVIRLYRDNKPRTIFEKLIEATLALRLVIAHSKREILQMYASNAPFGGNVVGLDAAAWRYYNRSASELSWAEAAALAVLPNSPSLVFPGRNAEVLRAKRDRLLKRLLACGDLDSLTYQLSLLEPLPGEPKPLPQLTPHLLTRAIADGKEGKIIETTIDLELQQRTNQIAANHHQQLAGNQVHNVAVLVLDIKTNSTLAYVGNSPGSNFGNHVDIITSPRSTGSILKPFLYAVMLHDGLILPNTLIPDIPTQIGGYSPKNYNPDYDGAIPASRAIARSLNVPAVRMLQQYGVERFQHILQKLGISTLNRTAENYGLSLILGGAEATLWDLAGVYAGMARVLNDFRPNQSQYHKTNFIPPHYAKGDNTIETSDLVDYSPLDASAIYFCFEAMKEVARPDELAGWQYFSSSRSVAWKTGTSFGHRDAWAIGLNPRYVVAVWVGNASGEGRPNLTGVSAAAPILFDVFALLPTSRWFEKPIDDMAYVPICRHSGHRASDICMPVDSTWIPLRGLETEACPYHRFIHLNQSRTHRVTDKCVSVENMVKQSWFVLPPAMEWFYKSKNPFYQSLPPYLAGCEPDNEQSQMALIYPRIEKTAIQLPRDLDGKPTEAIFEVVHRRENTTIFWHLNETYLGYTRTFHKMALQPKKGNHTLTLVDDMGNSQTVRFRVE
ncbi:MAG: penicillin-binding protein 1C [Tenuifilaceae bacterium]|jgi:penicillin-binding protein 1C|nr:penicillin-binding protein 1C [Tenuifilaceae bacterium]